MLRKSPEKEFSTGLWKTKWKTQGSPPESPVKATSGSPRTTENPISRLEKLWKTFWKKDNAKQRNRKAAALSKQEPTAYFRQLSLFLCTAQVSAHPSPLLQRQGKTRKKHPIRLDAPGRGRVNLDAFPKFRLSTGPSRNMFG